jgi:hypothetical protein
VKETQRKLELNVLHGEGEKWANIPILPEKLNLKKTQSVNLPCFAVLTAGPHHTGSVTSPIVLWVLSEHQETILTSPHM